MTVPSLDSPRTKWVHELDPDVVILRARHPIATATSQNFIPWSKRSQPETIFNYYWPTEMSLNYNKTLPYSIETLKSVPERLQKTGYATLQNS